MISVCFVHFRSLNLIHLDAAWYSLSRQNFQNVNSVYFLDNNTEFPPYEILQVLSRYPLPVPVQFCSDKHGREDRTQSWSVNRVCKAAVGPLVFFTRSDYILAFDAIETMTTGYRFFEDQGMKPFISGWCWQMAYDREAKNIDAMVDIEQYNWRELGMPALLQHPYAFRFHETDHDAGVWLTAKAYMAKAGWLNENLISWGYQQSTFQRCLRYEAGVTCAALQTYLFAHQHHYAERDFSKAASEYQRFGQGR